MSPRSWCRLVVLSGLLVWLGFAVPGWTETPKGKSYALLVGVRDYGGRSTLGPLKYTQNDVEALARVLQRPGSPFRGNVRVLTSTRGNKDRKAAPSAENIRIIPRSVDLRKFNLAREEDPAKSNQVVAIIGPEESGISQTQ